MAAYLHYPDLNAEIADIPPDSIVSRTFFQDEYARIILFGFAAGQELSEHTASKPATLHFLQGEAHIKLGGDEFEAKAGTWVHMPPNLPHSILAKTPVVMLLTMFEK
jgi:quercetin dioxygenase-like cupin family protein